MAASALRTALALSLGAAVSLGIARFAYGLLLPPMRADLGWSYSLAGAMNTSNAVGYLVGALCTPLLLRRFGPGTLMVWGSLCASVLMAVSGLFTDTTVWLGQRLVIGVASAVVFITGGLLAARLGATQPQHSGLLIGLYYGGTGLGISLSALLVPAVQQLAADAGHPWAWAWAALAAACFVCTAVLRPSVVRLERALAAGAVDAAAGSGSGGGGHARSATVSVAAVGRSPEGAGAQPAATGATAPRLRRFGFALAAYGMFGVGYIGYMTFIIALLHEQGLSGATITLFYTLLGAAVMASPRLWARLLDSRRDGRPLALLSGLLGVATILPALGGAWPLVFASGLVFGGVFLSLVASTTALVRHNLPANQWASGIGAFTIVFAAGQIVGPAVVGQIADGSGGLARGFAVSAAALWLGAVLAWRQRALTPEP